MGKSPMGKSFLKDLRFNMQDKAFLRTARLLLSLWNVQVYKELFVMEEQVNDR